MQGRTSIVIAHRLSTIKDCDLIFMLGRGSVIESGTFDELSSNTNSAFYKLKTGLEN
jgi:ATP-binding cassette subfamily B protein